jgi:hypothetical protein
MCSIEVSLDTETQRRFHGKSTQRDRALPMHRTAKQYSIVNSQEMQQRHREKNTIRREVKPKVS